MSVVGLRNLPRLDRQAKQFRFLIGPAGVAGTDATSSKKLRLLRLLLSQPFLPLLNNNCHQPSSHRSTTVTSLPPTAQQQSPAFLQLLNNSHQPSSHRSTTVTSFSSHCSTTTTVTSLPPTAQQQSTAFLPPLNNSHQPSLLPLNSNTITYGSGRQQLNWQRLGHVA